MNTWIIESILQNPFDYNHSTTDPEALYMWSLRLQGENAVTESSMSFAEAMELMRHFRVKDSSQLAGKKFQSERSNASSALNLLLIQIRHGGKYVPPTHESIRERVAQSLAKMEEPDFSDIDDETIFESFIDVWDIMSAKPEWLKKFTARIAEISNGRVSLIKAEPRNFSARVLGPAEYLMLVQGKQKQRIILGPYSTPVSFD